MCQALGETVGIYYPTEFLHLSLRKIYLIPEMFQEDESKISRDMREKDQR